MDGEIISIIIIVVAVIGLLFAAYSCDEKNVKDEIYSNLSIYESFSVNGERFNTDDIIDVEVHNKNYANDVYIFILDDGTKIEAQEGGIIWYK